MPIGPDGQEAVHVGMASFPHPASSRARPSAPTIVDTLRRRHSESDRPLGVLSFQNTECPLTNGSSLVVLVFLGHYPEHDLG
jgi:hypothetical protein